MKLNLGRYSKFVTAIIGQALTFITLYEGSSHWVAVVVAVAGALGVYAVPNTPAPPVVLPPLPPVNPA